MVVLKELMVTQGIKRKLYWFENTKELLAYVEDNVEEDDYEYYSYDGDLTRWETFWNKLTVPKYNKVCTKI
jgi:hypothetical protein